MNKHDNFTICHYSMSWVVVTKSNTKYNLSLCICSQFDLPRRQPLIDRRLENTPNTETVFAFVDKT